MATDICYAVVLHDKGGMIHAAWSVQVLKEGSLVFERSDYWGFRPIVTTEMVKEVVLSFLVSIGLNPEKILLKWTPKCVDLARAVLKDQGFDLEKQDRCLLQDELSNLIERQLLEEDDAPEETPYNPINLA